MAVTGKVYTNDMRAENNRMKDDGILFDRIITDVPSFTDRWPGSGGLGTIRDCVSGVIDLMKNNTKATSTATLSMTGVAQEKFDEWLASEDNTEWELVPNSEWAMFRPYYMNLSNNQHLWGRRDDWTYVRTFRKIGSDFTVKYDAWEGVPRVHMGGDNFPFPDDRSYIKYSAFRAPVHVGINTAKEAQQWFQGQGIKYTETFNEVHTTWTVSEWEQPGYGHPKSYIVMPSHSWTEKVHIPARWYNHGPLDSGIIEAIQKDSALYKDGLMRLFDHASGNHKHVMLSSWIVATHSEPDDHIIDPFCGEGSTGVAALIHGRNFTGIEFNASRSQTAERAITQIQPLVQANR